MFRNMPFVFSEASDATMTSAAGPDLTDLSVMNSPLAHRPAFVARPTRDNTLSRINRTHLLFQTFIHFRWNRLLERAFQPPALYRLLEALRRVAQIRPPAVFIVGRGPPKNKHKPPPQPQQNIKVFYLTSTFPSWVSFPRNPRISARAPFVLQPILSPRLILSWPMAAVFQVRPPHGRLSYGRVTRVPARSRPARALPPESAPLILPLRKTRARSGIPRTGRTPRHILRHTLPRPWHPSAPCSPRATPLTRLPASRS